MSAFIVSVEYTLYEQKSGERIAWMIEVFPVEDDGLGVISLPLPEVGATINFNETLGVVTERSGVDTEWTIRCVC